MSDEKYDRYVERKKNHHLGWACALIQTLPAPNKGFSELESRAFHGLLFTEFAECFDVEVVRYQDGSGRVTVGRATADWVNDVGTGMVLMNAGKVIEVNGGFFEADK